MPNYQNGKCYKIEVDGECYVGSTCQKLCKRMCGHRHNCKTRNKDWNYLLYDAIDKRGGWDNVAITLLEDFPCDTKEQLHARERYWFNIVQPTLNRKIPTRSQSEYTRDTKQKKQQYDKEYRSNPQYKIKRKQKRLENVEHYRKKENNYYKKNKETINKKCVCPFCCKDIFFKDRIRHVRNKHPEKLDEFVASNNIKLLKP
jgi:hypothetical protein